MRNNESLRLQLNLDYNLDYKSLETEIYEEGPLYFLLVIFFVSRD